MIESVAERVPLTGAVQSKQAKDPTRRAILNGVVNFAKGLLSVVVTLLLTPFLISYLGPADFGAWSLLGVFVVYVALIDLGISGATAKLIGELASGEVDRISQLFASSLWLLAIVSGLFLAIVLLLRASLTEGLAAFGLNDNYGNVFLVGIGALYVLGLLSNGLQYVLFGLHRLDVANYIAASILLLQALGIVAVLKAGWGLPGLIGLMAAASALSIIACYVMITRVAPGIRIYWDRSSFATARRILSFGIYLQGYALTSVYYFYGAKVVVGLLFPLEAVAAYEVALRLPLLLRQGILTILGPLMPAVSYLDARGESDQVRALLLRALRYGLLMGAPIFVGVAVFAEPIIRLWVGPEFSDSVLPLRILSIGLGLSVFPDIVWYFLVGLGRQRLATVCSLIMVVLGTCSSYFLASRLSLVGVASGVLVTAVLGVFLFVGILVRERLVLLRDIPVALGCKAFALAAAVFGVAFIMFSRIHLNPWNLALTFVLASVAYCLCVLKSGLLEKSERFFLRAFLPVRLGFLF